MSALESLRAHKAMILAIAQRHGASNVRVFGSVARGEATPESDVDLLVEMDDSRSLLDTIGLVQDLQDALGRKVDVVTENALHHLLRGRILSEATPL